MQQPANWVSLEASAVEQTVHMGVQTLHAHSTDRAMELIKWSPSHDWWDRRIGRLPMTLPMTPTNPYKPLTLCLTLPEHEI